MDKKDSGRTVRSGAPAEKEYYIDDIYHKRWDAGRVRSCPHPYMIRNRGDGAECIVCIYTCKSCTFALRAGMFDGIGCGYKKETG